MASQLPERNPVEELAEDFLDRYRRGERPALSEYTQKYPKLAEEILELFPALAMMEEVVPGSADGRHAQKSGITASGQALEQIGEYRIVREVGRGGMGIVYEAEQEALGRHVALKVLPFQMAADAMRLQRFRREARSAARLHHTNIVPVFDVGCHEGIHYYAMQFIRGQSLDQVILELQRMRGGHAQLSVMGGPPGEERSAASVRDLAHSLANGDWGDRAGPRAPEDLNTFLLRSPYEQPLSAESPGLPATVRVYSPGPAPGPQSRADAIAPAPGSSKSHSDFSTQSDFHYYRSVARLGIQVAEALAYAHAQNILHRDIKPANLLLDQQGTVWVTDFGLAKEQGSDLTQTGDLIGTLRYMAPERFKGMSDARSDVYSLGLTLYELVTQRIAFADSDRARLIKRVTHEEPVRPRKLDRHVPRDLETIILKAMAKEPGQRYRSASALAEDLRRFLADRPIRARRASLVEQTWRWCRRNPAVASLLGIISVLILGFSIATLGKNAQLSRTNREAMERLWESLRDRARALRSSGQPGQRVEALRSIREAMQLPLPAGHSLDELRTEAIAALPLIDVELQREWQDAHPHWLLIRFDPGCQRYVRVDNDGMIAFRSVAEDATLATWREEGFSRTSFQELSLALGPDGRHIAIHDANSHLLRVRRLEGPSAVLCHEARQVSPLARRIFTPDGGRLVYAQDDGRIAVFDLATRRVRYLPDKIDNPGYLQVDSPGKRLALTALFDRHPCLEVRDLETGRLQIRIRAPDKTRHLAWHAGGFILAGVIGDQLIHLWDVSSGKLLHVLRGHKNFGVRIAFERRSGLLVSNDWTGLLRIWDPFSGEQVLSIGSTGSDLLDGEFDGVIPGRKNTDISWLQVLRLHASPILRSVRRPISASANGYAGGAFNTLPGPDPRLLIVNARAEDSTEIAIMDLATGREIASLQHQEAPVHWEGDGALITCGKGGLLRWPFTKGPASSSHLLIGPPTVLLDYRSKGVTFSTSNDCRLIAIPNGDQGALLWNRDRPTQKIALKPQSGVRYTAISPDGRWVATGSHDVPTGKPCMVWDCATGGLAHEFDGPNTCQVQFSPDSRWLYTSNQGRLWHTGTWEEGPLVGGPRACFAPDGKLMAVEGDLGAIRLIVTDTGKEIARLEAPVRTRVIPSCFTCDGMTLVAGGIDTQQLHIWDLSALRHELAALGLDWHGPPYPTASPIVREDSAGLEPLRADVNLGFLQQRIEVEALIEQAYDLQKLNKPDEAIAALRKAVQIDPSHLKALNNLAWLLVTGPPALRDPQEALPLARRAVELAPKSALYFNTLGVALYRAGQYRGAIGYLEKSLAGNKGETDAYDLFFLAMCHAQLGERDQALQCRDRALAWLNKHRGELLDEGLQELKQFEAETAEVLGTRGKG